MLGYAECNVHEIIFKHPILNFQNPIAISKHFYAVFILST
jgi:hypothetical protein